MYNMVSIEVYILGQFIEALSTWLNEMFDTC